ncbi:MAG: hypothetical protein NTZ39_08770 [Methanoregula sp.]|nr:hypothetical protein [Methanoregula sp.]
MKTGDCVVKKKLTEEIDLKRMYEEEIEELNPIYIASTERDDHYDLLLDDKDSDRVRKLM